MPKREPTPPLEDDCKYFIINYPYPLHANMAIKSESHDLAHWIASSIGEESLTAIYHKPSAPNMVIIEVIKSCPKVNALLGAHKWREFLKNPEPDQINNESRVYYCRYGSSREVQKYGWRRLDIWDDWFTNFNPVRGPFILPYPKTYYCDVPPETQTDYGLCRPLPTDVFPRPKPIVKQAIVPGSDVYVNIKKSGAPLIAAPVPSRPAVKSWASVASVVSGTLSKTPSSETSPIDAPNAFAPPGLGPPPGLSSEASQTSSDWDFEPLAGLTTPVHSFDEPSDVEIITNGFAAAAIEDQQNSYRNQDLGGEEYWSVQPARPTDWEKEICPTHLIACRGGICLIMDDIRRKKKREAEGGWEQTKTKGRGRGQGNGRGSFTRGNGTRNSGRGGRGGGWV